MNFNRYPTQAQKLGTRIALVLPVLDNLEAELVEHLKVVRHLLAGLSAPEMASPQLAEWPSAAIGGLNPSDGTPSTSPRALDGLAWPAHVDQTPSVTVSNAQSQVSTLDLVPELALEPTPFYVHNLQAFADSTSDRRTYQCRCCNSRNARGSIPPDCQAP